MPSKIEKQLVTFLKHNPNPDDDKVHTWALRKKLNVHKVEQSIYRLATKYVKSKRWFKCHYLVKIQDMDIQKINKLD